MPRFEPRSTSTHTHQPTQSFQTGWSTPQYPTHKPLAIYGRQSTKNQVENNRESYEAQTQGLLQRAVQMGWKEDDIIVYTENIRADGSVHNASGRLRIDQREGLGAVVERIQTGEIGAVMVYQEDRLFRDETGIQYNVFIQVCKENHVVVVTPMYTYDFNHDRYAVRIFRDKMQQAADFYTDYSRRMIDLRARASRRGLYDGRIIPVGYLVDRVKTSPSYRLYIPYEPHAHVVASLFARFRTLCGATNELCREIEKLPFLFPEFEPWVDDREKQKIRLRRVPGGYTLTRGGLISILTNVHYLGWWVFQGEVVSKDNHPAIVNEDDFWYAYQKLAAFTPAGEANTQRTRKVRFTQQQQQETALLKRVISSPDGEVYSFETRRDLTVYTCMDTSGIHTRNLYSMKADYLDTVFVERMLSIAANEYLGDDILHAVEAEQQQQRAPLVTVEAQLRAITPQIEGLKASLMLPMDVLDPVSRADFARQLSKLRKDEEELLKKQQDQSSRFPTKKDAEDYADTLNRLPDTWEQLSPEKKRKVVELLVEEVRIKTLSPHWLGIQIAWKGFYGRVDLGYIWRGIGKHGSPWSEEELAQLRPLYATASRNTLLETFPHRPWSSIKLAGQSLGIPRKRGLFEGRNTPGSRIDAAALADQPIMDILGLKEPPTGAFCAYWTEASSQKGDTLSGQTTTFHVTHLFIHHLTEQLRTLLTTH